MVLLRYQVLALILMKATSSFSREIEHPKSIASNSNNCPFPKVPEEIFKVHNKSKEGIFLEDIEKAKEFLNLTTKANTKKQDDQVNSIIASINRIKKNITNKYTNDDEAIILSYPKKLENNTKENSKNESEFKNPFIKVSSNLSGPYKVRPSLKRETTTQKALTTQNTTTQSTFVEILTIEPNNTNRYNSSAHNIIEILKHLMPMFNSTLTKELHNLTVIERDRTSNHSFSAVKNISTIIVTYCDNENYTKANYAESKPEIVVKFPENSTVDDSVDQLDSNDEDNDFNMTMDERRDILEAADFGMQKMHELYSVTEPKLYSMGLWLDDGNPARYVAAFNAPTEDMTRYSRYGYASLQAATKLKELTGEDGLEGRTEENHFPSASALRQSALLQHCPIRGVPKCPPASKRYRTHDGTCNNFNRPRWGSTMTPVQRFQPPVYSDGLQAPRRSVLGPQLPSAREISSTIHEDQNIETPTITHLLMQWGQFLDHDVTSSSQSRGFNGSVPRCCKDGGRDFVPKDLMHPECMPISVPASDPFYGPKGVRCLDFVRSSPAPHDDCSLGWREQLNQVSAYIDASPMYGSSAQKSDKLRLFRNGMLQYGKVQQRRPILPPERKDELCRGGAVSSDCFKSGDARVNEHPGLVAAHIVWLRQHNRMAQELAHLNPHWSDEKIYQETRKIIGAMVQHITYKEFLPIVLGSEVMRLFDLDPLKKGFYRSYDPKINPSPASSFGSAAFRFGHSLVQPTMMRYDQFHRPMKNNVSLHDEQTNPSNIWSMGAVDRLLLGMVNQPIQKRDEFITEELTNHLFQTPKFSFGMDLAAINVQRGRDHGVAPYTSWREPCGLTSIKEFDDLFRVMPAKTVRKLRDLYRHVDDIDLFTGGMAERPVVGGLVGPTFACIIAQQFSNLRKGDRFWYENSGFESSFTPAQLQQIRRITFAQVLCRTLDTIDSIQPFAFLSSENSNNDRLPCSNGHLNNFDLSPWTEIDTNDISKDSKDEESSDSPKTTQRPTTSTTVTTSKPVTTTTKKDKIKPLQSFMNAVNKIPILNLFKNSIQNATQIDKVKTDSNMTLTRLNKFNMTVQKIDDKLDFKNKTRRDEDQFNHNEPTEIKERYDYDYDEDNVQSVQSVVINNHALKRPTSHKRPVIAVTENIDKYTYLINYVPKQTTSWRQTTRRPYLDRDVVKITYQNYDDTYRRPIKPYYYNRHQDRLKDDYRRDNPDRYSTKKDELHSSARSNDDNDLPYNDNDKKPDQTTENSQKLVTFGYVGTYKGDDKKKADLRLDNTYLSKEEPLSKDFSTYDKPRQTDNSMKLSTFFSFETTTKPYLNHRPTMKHDYDQTSTYFKPDSKYYYVKNELRQYPDIEMTLTERPLIVEDKELILESEHNIDKDTRESTSEQDVKKFFDAEDRTADLTLDEVDKAKTAQRIKLPVKNKRPPSSAAKTPSVAFQVIPSENSPSLWAVYEESADLPDGLPDQMPAVSSDPFASKEIPRPLNLALRKLKRKHGRK